jgi:hypothetical protein
MSDHGAQLQWKGQLGANPNPPCQHSLSEETGVSGEKLTTLGRALIFSHEYPDSGTRIQRRLLDDYATEPPRQNNCNYRPPKPRQVNNCNLFQWTTCMLD